MGEFVEQRKTGHFVQTYGVEGVGAWFHLYQCEHLSNDSYPLEVIIAIGEHSNMALCKHCWAGVKGAVLEEVIKGVIKTPFDFDALKEALAGAESPPSNLLKAARVHDILMGRTSRVAPDMLQSIGERDRLAPVKQIHQEPGAPL